MPITFEGDEIDAITFDGDPVEEVTFHGDVVWTATQVVDDFEDGNRSGWSVQGSGSDTVVSNGHDGTGFAWRHTGFNEVHLSGANAVDRGPQPGDLFEFWFRVNSASGSTINRFEFSASGMNENDVYRIEFERETGEDEFTLEKISNGGQAKVDSDPGHTVSLDTSYRCEVGWNYGNNNITAQLFLANGTAASNKLSITDDSAASAGSFTQPGIFLRTNANNTCIWDEIRITDTI